MPCAAATPTSIPMMPSSAQPCKGVGDHPRSLCRRRRTCANCDFLKEVWTMSAESLSLDQNGERRITPQKFSHTVIRTTRLKEMVEWYQTVLNAEIVREFPHLVFMTYDEEHHRLAFVSIPGLVERPKLSAGHDHLAFTYESLGDLVATYERLKAAGITPSVPVA